MAEAETKAVGVRWQPVFVVAGAALADSRGGEADAETETVGRRWRHIRRGSRGTCGQPGRRRQRLKRKRLANAGGPFVVAVAALADGEVQTEAETELVGVRWRPVFVVAVVALADSQGGAADAETEMVAKRLRPIRSGRRVFGSVREAQP